MALKTLPVLPENYPLWDWADWPDSRAALVSGGPTRNFQKECWNSIIDKLVAVQEAVGIEWTDNNIETYWLPEKIKICAPYCLFTEWTINITCWNLNAIADLGWRWALDPSFRGYVGRYYFSSTAYYPDSLPHIRPDKVYPEYILDVATRLNQIIEIMRGTAPVLETSVQRLSGTTVQPGVTWGKAAHADTQYISGTTTQTGVLLGKGIPGVVEYPVYSPCKAEAVARKAAVGAVEHKISVPVLAQGNTRPGVTLGRASHLAASQSFAAASAILPVLGEGKSIISAPVLADPVANPAASMAAQQLVSRHTWIDAVVSPACLGTAQAIAPVAVHAEGAARMALRISANALMGSRAQAEGISFPASSAAAEKTSGTLVEADAAAMPGLPGNASARAFSRAQAEGVSHPALTTEASGLMGSMSLAEPEAKPAVASSVGAVAASLSTGTLQCRQGRAASAKALIGAKTAASGECNPAPLAKVSCRVGSLAQCALDTAWLPPMWVDGGLWIRQAYAVTQNENGELEVS